MIEFFSNQSEDMKMLLVKIAAFAIGIVILALLLKMIIRNVRHSLFQLDKLRSEMEEHEIETIRTSFFSRSDVSLWIKEYMKSGTECLLMTGQVAWEKDHDIVLPPAKGGSVLYLCIFHSGKQKVIRHRFIVADSIEPALDRLLREHSGAVWFTR